MFDLIKKKLLGYKTYQVTYAYPYKICSSDQRVIVKNNSVSKYLDENCKKYIYGDTKNTKTKVVLAKSKYNALVQVYKTLIKVGNYDLDDRYLAIIISIEEVTKITEYKSIEGQNHV